MKKSQIQYYYFALNMLVNTSAVYDVWIFNMSEPFGFETTHIIKEMDDCDRYDSTIRSRTRYVIMSSFQYQLAICLKQAGFIYVFNLHNIYHGFSSPKK